jgi:hypothetical protein
MRSIHLSALGALVLVGAALIAQIPGIACASAPPGIAADGGSCSGDPVCDPGNVQTCGNCGKATCDPCGQWGTCTDQGICKPGDEGPDGCYEGQNAVCNDSCEWVCP